MALREAGLPESDVRLVIVRDLANRIDHAVAAARIDETWVMLDNRRLVLVEDNAMAPAVPLLPLPVLPSDRILRYFLVWTGPCQEVGEAT